MRKRICKDKTRIFSLLSNLKEGECFEAEYFWQMGFQSISRPLLFVGKQKERESII